MKNDILEMTEEEKRELFAGLKEDLRLLNELEKAACARGDHGMHLRHVGCGIGHMYWKCSRCGTIVTTPIFVVTI